MRKSIRVACATLAVLTGLAGPMSAGSALAQPAYAPIPPPRAEVVPPPPGGHAVWVPGHWRWNGVRYVWLRGRYLIRPARYTAWEPEHWALRGGVWVWVPGHWR